jgi:hypothetical protein
MRHAQAGEAEGVYIAAFDMDKIRAWRERESRQNRQDAAFSGGRR